MPPDRLETLSKTFHSAESVRLDAAWRNHVRGVGCPSHASVHSAAAPGRRAGEAG